MGTLCPMIGLSLIIISTVLSCCKKGIREQCMLGLNVQLQRKEEANSKHGLMQFKATPYSHDVFMLLVSFPDNLRARGDRESSPPNFDVQPLRILNADHDSQISCNSCSDNDFITSFHSTSTSSPPKECPDITIHSE